MKKLESCTRTENKNKKIYGIKRGIFTIDYYKIIFCKFERLAESYFHSYKIRA